MTIALTAFTARGLALAQRLADGLNAQARSTSRWPTSPPTRLPRQMRWCLWGRRALPCVPLPPI